MNLIITKFTIFLLTNFILNFIIVLVVIRSIYSIILTGNNVSHHVTLLQQGLVTRHVNIKIHVGRLSYASRRNK